MIYCEKAWQAFVALVIIINTLINNSFYLMFYSLLVDQFKKKFLVFIMGFLESPNSLTAPLPRYTYHYTVPAVEKFPFSEWGVLELLLPTPLPLLPLKRRFRGVTPENF
jgi:hypothetical protein